MLDTLISSKTRVKLLLKFFLNDGARGYLRSLAQEFGESTNAIRLELNKLEQAGMLRSQTEGNKRVYRANRKHPLFDNLHQLMMKHIGLDKVVEGISAKLGAVEAVYLVGDYAEGRDSGIIDLFFLASDLKVDYLVAILSKIEREIERKLRFVQCKTERELKLLLQEQSSLLIWCHTTP